MENNFKFYSYNNYFFEKCFIIISILEENEFYGIEIFLFFKEREFDFKLRGLNISVRKNIALQIKNNQKIEDYLLFEGIYSSKEIIRIFLYESFNNRPEYLQIDHKPIEITEFNKSHFATLAMMDEKLRLKINDLTDYINNKELRKYMYEIMNLPRIVSKDPFKRDPFHF